MGLFIVMAGALLCTIPSSFIAQRLLRKKHGRDLALLDAPTVFMELASPVEKLLLIGLNFTIAAGMMWLLFQI